ncbi:MAG: methyltransferase domain-containing protein [Akkermansiaceae bacterium]
MITDEKLIEQYQHMHKSSKYGRTARSAVATLQLCLDEVKPSSVLEYGCGQSRLSDVLAKPGMTYDRYDPAIPSIAKIPAEKYEFLINTDVLEHIPEKDLDSVLSHFRSLTEHAYIRISTRLARNLLPNGENAHCTVWPGEKWLEFIKRYYPDAQMPYDEAGETCVILTWNSGLAETIHEMESKWAQRKVKPVRRFFKSVELFGRRLRDSVFGNR